MSSPALVSIGDEGVLNARLPGDLADVWLDRDLGWLDFNDRVLAEALDSRVPLLERAKFLAIFTSNLDEFFMKRMAVLRQGEATAEIALVQRLRHKLLPMLQRQADCFRNSIVPELAKHGVAIRHWDELTRGQQEEASAYFDVNVSPALTPLVIDPANPSFPFLANLSTSLIFRLRDPRLRDPRLRDSRKKDLERTELMYARCKVPSVLKQWVALTAEVSAGHTSTEQRVLTPLYEIIRGNIRKLYSGMTLSACTMVRLTRDAEVEIEDDESGIREMVEEQVRQRRYEPVVRLEFSARSDAAIRKMLQTRFGLAATDVYSMPGELDYTTLFELAGLPLPELKDEPWIPLMPPALEEDPNAVFDAITTADILVHHPYESFDASVEHFISVAADDPQTVSIKMTAYRIGDDTPFVESLMRAAERGKQVACVMEIKARFDEERNLHWAAELERVGAHVTFGVRGLKTHAKTALVVRKEGNGLQCYVHIGTGNYHVKTARLYADFGLLTRDPRLTSDVVNLFHFLTGHGDSPQVSTLLLAPSSMRPRMLELIRREIAHHRSGKPARIIAKMNQLEDPEMIEALCAASEAGVSVELIIRGFCCLLPGVPGRTENIRVRSIIGRFLEHSRIFHFANGEEDPLDGDFLIGSADWMVRNLSKRVEVVTPIFAASAKERLWEVLDICLRDQRQAWVLGTDGTYAQLQPAADCKEGPELLGTHRSLMDIALGRAVESALTD